MMYGLLSPLMTDFVDHHLGDVLHGGQLIHGVEQHVFQDGAQAAGTGLAVHGLA